MGECLAVPDLFREGQGVVAEGVLAAAGAWKPTQILAKHDERYMPSEVVDALKKQGRWQEGQKMIVEAGHFALALALAISCCRPSCRSGAHGGTTPADGRRRRRRARPIAFVGFAFGALAYAHMTSDFSVLNVAENSHSAMPAIYKFSGVWGNHEGSMLLWSLILATFRRAGGALRRRPAASSCAPTRSPSRA